MSDRLGTAQWEAQPVVSRRYPFIPGKFWLGRSEDETAIGYRDDRHICVVSGTRGGKGTSIIVNNLCFWPGSAVVVDPKGENATVTAARRGRGSEHCAGMGQAVHVLDPFTTAHVDERYRSCFNPLADLDPRREETIDEASRLANAIVVVKDDAHEPFWDESARTMVRGLILHVLTAKQFSADERNLITVRKLIQRGAWEIAEAIRATGQEQTDPPHLLLWRAMELNQAFDGIIAGIGSQFASMMISSAKTFQGVLQGVANHTEFLDSPGMRRVLSKSDFKLSELKTRREGMTLYLSLPQRYMDTHYRWLRMMVSLTTTEMEITRGQPASGHPVLMVLDEFAGLKRMAAIENAVAQIAGFGVKLLFVLQSLEQLKATYKDNWETFLSNAGVKVFFSIEDHFTREYISKLAGETEIIRELRSSNQSQSENKSYAEGRSRSDTRSQSSTAGASASQTRGTSQSVSDSQTHGVNQSSSTSQSFGWNSSSGWSSSPQGFSNSASSGSSSGTTHGTSQGTSSSTTRGSTFGTSASDTQGRSSSETSGTSSTTGTSETETRGTAHTAGTGQSESVHRRPLIQPDEIGRHFARIDETNHPGYPGGALVMISGANPLVVKRAHYFEDVEFIDCFSPHPDHKFLSPVSSTVKSIRPLIDLLEASMRGRRLTIARWLVEQGKVITTSNAVAEIEGVPPGNRTVHIGTPCMGKVSATAATPQNRLPAGNYLIPDAPLFTVRSYPGSKGGIDPLEELREACRALQESKQRNRVGLILLAVVAALALIVLAAQYPWQFFSVAAALGLLIFWELRTHKLRQFRTTFLTRCETWTHKQRAAIQNRASRLRDYGIRGSKWKALRIPWAQRLKRER